MIASLGMYDLPHLRGAHDRLWAHIRTALGSGPDHLTRGGDPWAAWRAPDLLLGQTCGLPYRAHLHEQVTLVGTPHYDLPDCPPGYYFSYLIRRRDDTRPLDMLARQGTLAFNEPLSQSGWAAPVAQLAAMGLHPGTTRPTGAHLASVSAVLDGTADYAAIDALTFLLWGAHDPDTCARIDAFARTAPTPALPYITARHRDPAPIAAAIRTGIDALDPADRHTLRLKGIVAIPKADYLAVPIPPAP